MMIDWVRHWGRSHTQVCVALAFSTGVKCVVWVGGWSRRLARQSAGWYGSAPHSAHRCARLYLQSPLLSITRVFQQCWYARVRCTRVVVLSKLLSPSLTGEVSPSMDPPFDGSVTTRARARALCAHGTRFEPARVRARSRVVSFCFRVEGSSLLVAAGRCKVLSLQAPFLSWVGPFGDNSRASSSQFLSWLSLNPSTRYHLPSLP